jgi:hypothetical protein
MIIVVTIFEPLLSRRAVGDPAPALSSGAQKLVDGIDSDDKVTALSGILENKASLESDRVAAIQRLGQLKTAASAQVLIDNIDFVYHTKNGMDQAAVRALKSLGAIAVEPIMQFIQSHSDDSEGYRNKVALTVIALFYIKSHSGGKEQPDGFSQFVQQNEHNWTPQVRKIMLRDAIYY